MASAVIKFSAILMFVGVCFADDADFNNPGSIPPPPVTEVCFGCLCQASSGCIQSLKCEDGACGLFRITQSYWTDAGKPTVDGAPVDSPNAFDNCAFDPYCAALTVQGYMKKFAQDCNGDGQISCYDYMAIHKRGGYDCVGDLPFQYVSVFNKCVASVRAIFT